MSYIHVDDTVIFGRDATEFQGTNPISNGEIQCASETKQMFLGHIFDVSGVRFSEARVQVIRESPNQSSSVEEKSTSEPFRKSQESRAAFALIKDQLSKSCELVIIYE